MHGIARNVPSEIGSVPKMNDIQDYIGSALIIVIAIFMYVFVIQIVNDATCGAMERAVSPVILSKFLQFLSLCWW